VGEEGQVGIIMTDKKNQRSAAEKV